MTPYTTIHPQNPLPTEPRIDHTLPQHTTTTKLNPSPAIMFNLTSAKKLNATATTTFNTTAATTLSPKLNSSAATTLSPKLNSSAATTLSPKLNSSPATTPLPTKKLNATAATTTVDTGRRILRASIGRGISNIKKNIFSVKNTSVYTCKTSQSYKKGRVHLTLKMYLAS